MNKLKVCPECETTKELLQFNKSRRNDDGLQRKCKNCEGSYYKENKERLAPLRKKYYLENREVLLAISKQYFKTPRGHLSTCKSTAKKRGIYFNLSDKFALELLSKSCFVTDCKRVVTGLDRIDSLKGYIESNVRPSCEGHNLTRLDYSDLEFYELTKAWINWFENSNKVQEKYS